METIGEKIWRIEGRKPGPHLMVLGGVHGNERTGVQAVRWLRERFGPKGERLVRGTLTIALGNPEAVRKNMRGSAAHRDLNRCFTPEKIAAPSTYEERRAAELAPIVAGADALVDLHAVNTPSDPFVVATAHDAERAAFGACFPGRIFLVAPDEIIPGSTDGWIGRHGGCGIGYESGYMKDLSRMAEVKRGLDRLLRKTGLVAGRAGAGESQRVIRLVQALVLDGETFAFAPGRGKTSFEPVLKGEVLGHVDGRPLRAAISGLLVFPKPKRLHKRGQPIGFLAVKGRP